MINNAMKIQKKAQELEVWNKNHKKWTKNVEKNAKPTPSITTANRGDHQIKLFLVHLHNSYKNDQNLQNGQKPLANLKASA